MGNHKNRRPQTSKRARQEGNPEMMRGFQELRKGSRAQPHRDKSKYTRKSKYKEF